MPVGLYMDVHVPSAITFQLRSKGVDVITAQDDGTTELEDDQLIIRSSELNRPLFTQDIRFKAMAEQWQREGRSFNGLLFGHQLGATIGRFVQDLELIAKASFPADWVDVVEYLPYPTSQ